MKTRMLIRRMATIAVCSAFTPRAALADDCSGIRDCYAQLLLAALVIAALVLLVAIAWELFAGAAAVEGAEALAMEVVEAEGAEGAMAAERAAAEARLESIAAESNSAGGTRNCSWVAREMDEALGDMFAGRTPEPYAPDWFTQGSEFAPDATVRGEMTGFSNVNTMAAEYGSSFQPTTMDGIVSQLEAAGNGSRGIVWVYDTTGAHVFNAVNYGGEVFFVDGQAAGLGQAGVWTDTGYMAGYSPVDTIVNFMLTGG